MTHVISALPYGLLPDSSQVSVLAFAHAVTRSKTKFSIYANRHHHRYRRYIRASHISHASYPNRSRIYPTYVGRESITMDHGMHDTMMSLLLILAILVLGLYFTLILIFDKSRVSLYATPLTGLGFT